MPPLNLKKRETEMIRTADYTFRELIDLVDKIIDEEKFYPEWGYSDNNNTDDVLLKMIVGNKQ